MKNIWMQLRKSNALKEQTGFKKSADQSGMTLIEIMIVMIIIGGLMATLGTKVMDNLKKARVKQAKIEMGEMKKALELFYADCNEYPTDLEALEKDPGNCSDWGPTSYYKVKKDPWGGEFSYESEGDDFKITAFGEDKSPGGSGVDRDIIFPEQDEDDDN